MSLFSRHNSPRHPTGGLRFLTVSDAPFQFGWTLSRQALRGRAAALDEVRGQVAAVADARSFDEITRAVRDAQDSAAAWIATLDEAALHRVAGIEPWSVAMVLGHEPRRRRRRAPHRALAGQGESAGRGRTWHRKPESRVGLSAFGESLPGALSYDGTYRWVGEFKFSDRSARFSPME